MRNFNKYLIVGVSFLFAVGAVGIGMWYSQSQTAKLTTEKPVEVSKKKEETKETHKKEAKKKPKTDNTKPKATLSLDDFYADQEHVFLAADLTNEKMVEIKDNLSDYSKEDQKSFKRVSNKWKIQKELNDMFETPILVGDNLLEATLKTDISEKSVNKLEKKLKAKKFEDYFAITVQDIIDNKVRSGLMDSSETDDDEDKEQEALAAEEATKKEQETLEAEEAAKKEQEALEAEETARKEQEALEAEEAARKEQETLEAEEAARKEQDTSEAEETAKEDQEGVTNHANSADETTEQVESNGILTGETAEVGSEGNSNTDGATNEETTVVGDSPM